MGHKKIDLVDNFTYLGCFVSKEGGWNDDVQSRIGKPHDVIS